MTREQFNKKIDEIHKDYERCLKQRAWSFNNINNMHTDTICALGMNNELKVMEMKIMMCGFDLFKKD